MTKELILFTPHRLQTPMTVAAFQRGVKRPRSYAGSGHQAYRLLHHGHYHHNISTLFFFFKGCRVQLVNSLEEEQESQIFARGRGGKPNTCQYDSTPCSQVLGSTQASGQFPVTAGPGFKKGGRSFTN